MTKESYTRCTPAQSERRTDSPKVRSFVSVIVRNGSWMNEPAFKPIRGYGCFIKSSYERNFVMRMLESEDWPRDWCCSVLNVDYSPRYGPVMLCHRECKGNETMSLSLFKMERFAILTCDTIIINYLAFVHCWLINRLHQTRPCKRMFSGSSAVFLELASACKQKFGKR
jgi:hypothetical protein